MSSSYAINKAIYAARKRNGLKADARDYEEERKDYRKPYYRLDVIERKLDNLIEMVQELRSNPPVKQLIKPIIITVSPNSSKEQIKSQLDSYLE